MKTYGCIIPCYKGDNTTIEIIKELLILVNYVVLVDDCCPNSIGKIAKENIKDKKLVVIKNEYNQGVGASVIKGFIYLLSVECDFIIKVDADGQISSSQN